MNPNYKVLKTKCSVCGHSYKKVVANEIMYDTTNFVSESFTRDTGPVCKSCDRTYKILGGYSGRGYGYKYSTSPKRTPMDKESTPTFGIEIEVAGNIKSIEKIDKVANNDYSRNPECSIGYDSSLSGAQFELSYSPGTYYWYVYESNFKNVCKMLQKDKWATTDETTGMHIHIGTIPTTDIYVQLQKAAQIDNMFWTILKVLGEREYNRYCMPIFQRQHHDCINRSQRWRTLEFRMFASTFDYNKILNRIKFLRQLTENFDYEGHILWHNFKDQTKIWFLELLDNCQLNVSEEDKEKIRLLFKEAGHWEATPASPETEIWLRYSADSEFEDEEYEDEEEYEENY